MKLNTQRRIHNAAITYDKSKGGLLISADCSCGMALSLQIRDDQLSDEFLKNQLVAGVRQAMEKHLQAVAAEVGAG